MREKLCADSLNGNEGTATLVLTFVHKLLAGTLTWMGAYIDLESGTLSTVDITPDNVVRLTGLKVSELRKKRT